MENRIETLVDWMIQSKRTVILTGAGMSTESGLRDFRSQDGWWQEYDPAELATTENMHTNYDLFHSFYAYRINSLRQLKPHIGHAILAKWEDDGLVQAIATQNVDGFHKEAGSRNVHELHGNLKGIRCIDCGHSFSQQAFLDKKSCPQCGGRLRPGVVLFGEGLPKRAWNASLQSIYLADLVIVIGSQLKVYPVAELPAMTRGKCVYINREFVNNQVHFDLMLKGNAGEIIEKAEAIRQKKMGNEVG